ncbi:LysR substrate-binding domain-containing protein [Cognatishimia sp. WU-CL00825]|uniref:LysR substrate-binding domain-containing protein n=1 Tax=Cognatishimia sp. WU-CL00825 TaxID=3127658 RepID=UPI003104BBA1
MARTHFNLPPLSALDAFEAAARHRSFKRGAAELNVSPSAVSHQVKALESELGITLFERTNRGVNLNRDGTLLYVALEHGFGHIADAIESLRKQSSKRGVQVIATTAMSHLWLTPRLGRFWREHAHVTVNQQVNDYPWTDERYDLLIRYGDMKSDGGECRLLFEDKLRPLTSPSFAQLNPVKDLADLARLPLIHLNALDRQWTRWKDWLAEMGYSGPVPDGLSVNNYIIALQAARDGMGVVLGWERLTTPLLNSGALQVLTDFCSPASKTFYVRQSPHAGKKAKLLRDWLVETAHNEAADG